MSLTKEHIMGLAGINASKTTESELQSTFRKLLNQGVHGLCFSPYANGQKPGSALTEDQIENRLDIIKPFTSAVRTFSCTAGNEMIPRIAHENGLGTMVGAWLGKDLDRNEMEIENAIAIAKDGYADSVAVGNEVMYRGDLSEDKLIEYISRVKSKLSDVPVGYVDAYYEFCNRPAITEVCDIIFANCYPYWEGCHMDYSLLYMKDMYRRACEAAKGKKVVISETGWPSQGSAFEGSNPSYLNALVYFINTQLWTQEEGIEVFYFSSFDEDWKVHDEGDVGAYWGLWDKDGNLKFG